MSLREQIKKNILLLILLIFTGGCGVWTNFTTYFNLYYNTKHLFDDAEKEILAQRSDLFSPTIPQLNTTTEQKLQKVIQKCSNILQFKSDSKYVDDALLMLGKTFYYQQNYLKSERELNELLATQKDSDLRLEAQLWIGKCQLKLQDFSTGLKTLAGVQKEAMDNGDDDILESVLVEELKFKVASKDYDGAIKASENFLKISNDNTVCAKVAFELGKLYEIQNDEESAAKAYAKVLDYSPPYEMELNSKIAYGSALLKAGHKNEAFNLFDDMSSEDKYKDAFDHINYKKGVTLDSLERYQEALNVLVQVDTTYRNTQYAGAARFEIGKLYEYDLNNFDSAYTYYLKAKSSVVPHEYLESLIKKAEKFRKYNELKDNLDFNKTQLRYALNPESFVNDSIAYVKMLDSVKQMEKENLNTPNLTEGRSFRNTRENNLRDIAPPSFQTRALELLKTKPPEKPVVNADSIKRKIVFAEYELGNLFYSGFNIPDSAYYYYSDILQNYPETGYRAKTLFVMGNLFLANGDTTKADSLFNYIYDNYKNDQIVNVVAGILNKPTISFDYDRAESIYEQAETELNKQSYNTSINYLTSIYSNYPKSMLAPKALYAEGWILENKLDKPDSAAIIYDSLTSRYPKSEYAINVSSKLRYYHSEKERVKKEIEDSLASIQKLKEKSIVNDSTKTAKVNPLSGKKEESKPEENISPVLSDSLKEYRLMTRRDSILQERRRELLKNESALNDSLKGNNSKASEDSTKLKKIR